MAMVQINLETNDSKIDALIVSLEAWHIISTRTRNCLGRLDRAGDAASTVTGTPIEKMRLSHLSRCEQADIFRLPNLGWVCYCEIAAVMDRYGWRFHDRWTGKPQPPALELLGPSLARYLERMSRAAAARGERFALGEAMLRLYDEEGLSGPEIGKRLGITGAAAHAAIQKARRTMDIRSRLPLAAAPPSF